MAVAGCRAREEDKVLGRVLDARLGVVQDQVGLPEAHGAGGRPETEGFLDDAQGVGHLVQKRGVRRDALRRLGSVGPENCVELLSQDRQLVPVLRELVVRRVRL